MASSWGTEDEEREEEVGEGGEEWGVGDRRGERRETIRNESWEAYKCSLPECCGHHGRGGRVGHACKHLMRAWLPLRESASMGHK